MWDQKDGITEMDNRMNGGDIKNTFGFFKNRDIEGDAAQGQGHRVVIKRGDWKAKNFELGFDGGEIGLNTSIGEVIAVEKFNEGQDNRMRNL